MSEEVDFTISFTEEQMQKSYAHLKSELAKIRAGKANPSMLDSIMVDYYGVDTPLNQVANVSTPDAQTLAIQPWEKTMIEPIEKAISDANLGLNPYNDAHTVRINIPPLTEERRIDLVKQAKAEAENCKVSIRNNRRESNEEIKKLVKDGLGEDEAKDAEEKIQGMTNSHIGKVDNLLEAKEKEILTV
ncbi:MAG TPA: ribosome recycling factor [Flavobacteriales bacterium]|nr:ribosome recycling factor [Flavobacteriales bacterium]HIA11417.1 ribosome recycling factor [Flavobacteriales bacterium]